jgi:hypothetical protein
MKKRQKKKNKKRNPLAYAMIQRSAKAGAHKNKKKAANKRKCRKKVSHEC